ncbi:hypothetical protein GCM10022377_11120 [Zhihengliuella alba]|uniref:DUF3027 domain-containing protein n=1 Tax=Zhihengliuella alba TaxID=547018 RepID=A0ABP7D5T1_9MICC
MARTPKLDAVLAAQVESARAALTELVAQDQIGDHLEATAEGERLVMHRFEARVPGYGGWQWFVTLARGPRMKVPTVCDSGLLPGAGALLAPDWVPWAERVAPEELEAERLAEAAAAAAEGAADGGAGTTSSSAGSPEEDGAGGVRPTPETAEAGSAGDGPVPSDAEDSDSSHDTGRSRHGEAPGAGAAPEAAATGDDDARAAADADADSESEQPRRPRRRRRARRATRG